MYESHHYTLNGVCPCEIGEDAVARALSIYQSAKDIKSFAEAMERQRVIGKRIWYDEAENTIYISKRYANESGGCERCHCDHYNQLKDPKARYPKYYCQCGAEFYRPMFAPIFGENVTIAPYKTLLSGDDECVLAIRIGKGNAK